MIKIQDGNGFFTINGSKHPKGVYSVTLFGNGIVAIGKYPKYIAYADYADYRDSEDSPFESDQELADYLNLVFRIGGGNGFGVAQERESNTVIFDGDYIIGNADPRSGDVVYDFSGSHLGAVTMMIHEDATSFTIQPANTIILSAPEDMSVARNYIYFNLVDNTIENEVVHVTITQEQI